VTDFYCFCDADGGSDGI